ncbi:peptidylprolyl isomerase [Guyparkeria hydrothermalis]|uniref:peptidylprolyl isomerase n=1 Tax=Guyparkeria hydrothermalis TaxID=923 RepID=UPI00201FFF8A|nr:peptidylprolyl isomerase [Guyparkeria hydrothermalis]MCL7745246.1 peptidylprolyl isomerase [Guyparkeria hydrothermalis]
MPFLHAMTLRRPTSLLAALLLACAPLTPSVAQSQPDAEQSRGMEGFQPLDRIVAVVNERVITQRELEAEVAQLGGQVDLASMGPSERQRLAARVLDRMITEAAMLERAKKIGIQIDDTRLNQALDGIASRNGMNLSQLRQAVIGQGQDWAAFRDGIRDQMIIEELQKREVYGQINISDREIDDYIEQRTGASAEQTEYRLAQILVSVPENASPSEIETARERAETIRDELEDGEEFARVSAERSDALNAEEGGDLGWREPARIPSLFLPVVRDLEVGQVSDIIRSPNGFHIVKLADTRTTTGGAAVTQYRAEHVLLRPRSDRDPDATRKLAQELRERIASGEARFGAIAREFSDDPGSAKRGGDLGWVNPDEMVPAFAQRLESVKVGELSPVFQSQFGFHFLRVNDTRRQDVSGEDLRQQARNAIGERRADEELTKYIRRLRAEAYIENRLTGTVSDARGQRALGRQ